MGFFINLTNDMRENNPQRHATLVSFKTDMHESHSWAGYRVSECWQVGCGGGGGGGALSNG